MKGMKGRISERWRGRQVGTEKVKVWQRDLALSLHLVIFCGSSLLPVCVCVCVCVFFAGTYTYLCIRVEKYVCACV